MASLRLLPKSSLNLKCLAQVSICQTRQLNLMEYQSKELLHNNHVCVQKFKIVENSQETKLLPQNFNVAEYVVKAQILAGGRGLGRFSNGFKGGVHVTKDPMVVTAIVEKMLGHKLITKQTPKDGILVKKVMVAESVNIRREAYLCILMDRDYNGPVLIASPNGGMDIETVAVKTPELVKTVPIDIFEGIAYKTALDIAYFLGFKEETKGKAASEIIKLWDFFLEVDALQVEINPLVETDNGSVVSVDAKIMFDDSAQYRQQKIFAYEDFTEGDPREIRAAQHRLNYISMSGNIGCLVNGAGLAMATMDIIKLHGGEPANFLDVGGGVNENQVYEAFCILSSDKNVKAILVNIFGGIVNCGTIANGIVNACRNIGLNIPLIVRLEGTNVEAAKHILADSGLPIISASDLDDAALKAVHSLQQ